MTQQRIATRRVCVNGPLGTFTPKLLFSATLCSKSDAPYKYIDFTLLYVLEKRDLVGRGSGRWRENWKKYYTTFRAQSTRKPNFSRGHGITARPYFKFSDSKHCSQRNKTRAQFMCCDVTRRRTGLLTPRSVVGYSARGSSVAEWLACWTRAQKGPGSNRSRDAVG